MEKFIVKDVDEGWMVKDGRGAVRFKGPRKDCITFDPTDEEPAPAPTPAKKPAAKKAPAKTKG